MKFLPMALPPALVITARLRNKLLPWYSRRHAQQYESKRQGKRWKLETRTFRSLFGRVNPTTVLDCPVGTGRWFDIYQEHGATVLGIDLSKDMLAEAAKKIRAGAKITLKRADILTGDGDELGAGYELIVCIRFVHWLRLRDVARLMARFSATRSPYLLLGARVSLDTPEEGEPERERSLVARLKHALTFSHVHEEKTLLGVLSERGWSLVQRVRIGRGGSWSYYFYLLRNTEPRSP
jgi:SAM-dependent methyltransferase